jgi:hypothetical protein
MSVVKVDASTGCLLIDGKKVFPIVLSEPPPLGATTLEGKDAWAEVAAAGANFIRSGRNDWNLQSIDQQVATERTRLDAAQAHGLHCWLRLANVANLPAASGSPSTNEQLLDKIVNAFKGHAGLGAYKGVDEPANPNRPAAIAADGLVRAHQKLKALDPNHPLTITQAPLVQSVDFTPYRPAFDITGADIYPVSYPPGDHTDLPNKDISVVGDLTKIMVRAAGGKPVWMTLQIAWSGVLPTRLHPELVPRFPTLQEERFMVYQAIIDGARGLVFFGGDLTEVMRTRDAKAGWNWTFWNLVLRALLVELTSPTVQPALLAANAPTPVKTATSDIEIATRQNDTYLYVIAVRRGGTTSQVVFTGLPSTRSGAPITGGEVAFEYAQNPLPPPPQPDKQVFRSVGVANDSFHDWFGPHDTHVYRFKLA